ncbi:MAG: peptidase T [Rubripirellula sp.]|nr:peptidase T [Rubripirellula sp.]
MKGASTQVVPINRNRLLDRFIKYVKIDTAANPFTDEYPSSHGQFELGKILLEELLQLGVDDAHQDENGLIWGTLLSNVGHDSPTIGLVAHLDTSPEAPSKNISPQVVECYDGNDLCFANGETLTVEECPELRDLQGKTLVCSGGDTLLGGDDKAGVAIIMELVTSLVENPNIKRGPIKILMTCDEEIGRGTDKIDLQKLNANVAYTIDGGGAGVVDTETFSADAVRVHFKGKNIHPAIAKGRMVNAIRAAGDFLAKLPSDECSPESTEGREGFIHAYGISGGVGEATIEILLRSFETVQLTEFAKYLTEISDQVRQQFPGLEVTLEITKQYRNLRDSLVNLPAAVELPCRAFELLARPYERAIIRGGTDGSQLSEKGLPTPNLSSGQHQIHSTKEFACLDEMIEAIEHLQILAQLWANERIDH